MFYVQNALTLKTSFWQVYPTDKWYAHTFETSSVSKQSMKTITFLTRLPKDVRNTTQIYIFLICDISWFPHCWDSEEYESFMKEV